LSIRRQCELLGLNRSTWYVKPATPDAAELAMMRRLDEQYLLTPFYGSRRMAVALDANRKCMQRLMRLMGIEAIYPKPKLSQRNEEHRIYPYLLRNMAIIRPNQVWASDITYVPMPQGWMYLTAVMDWHSRFVLSWRLSNTIDGMFCVEALSEALANFGQPEIFNGEFRPAGNIQHRSGRAVHGRRVHQPFGNGGRGDQHGRPRPLDGQRVRGAVVADAEVRIYLPSRPRHASRFASRAGGLHSVLQRGAVP
jgi:transposase InsO family protein